MFYPFQMMIPMIPVDYDLPPTLYRIMNSIANFDATEQTKIRDLAKATHEDIFDFTYPLSEHINKEEFECLILNKFIRRRIGFETMTSFKLALEVKLNEIMPNYNILFDSLDGWDLFNDGERISTIKNENGASSGSVSGSSTNDNRYSDTPQGHLTEVQDGTYMSDYTYTQGTTSTTSSATDNKSTSELKTRTPSDKIEVYKKFLENRKSIMSMIFNDLECLFYGLV